MIKAAGLVSQAGTQFISLQRDLNQISLNAGGLSAGDRPAEELLKNISDGLSQVQDKIVLAQTTIAQIDSNNAPPANRQNFVQLKFQLNILALALKNFAEVFTLAKNLALGEKKPY